MNFGYTEYVCEYFAIMKPRHEKKDTFQKVVSFGEYEAFQNVPLVSVVAIVLNMTASVNKQNDQIFTQFIRCTMELTQSAILQFDDKVIWC